MLNRASSGMVLATATVDLVSKVMRPWEFKVTVTGKPPHNVTKIYRIRAPDDNAAAFKGLSLFEKDMSHPLSILQML